MTILNKETLNENYYSLNNLTTIYLFSNKITEIDSDAFNGITTLKEINLKNHIFNVFLNVL